MIARPVGGTFYPAMVDPGQGLTIETPFYHAALFVHRGDEIIRQYSLQGGAIRFDEQEGPTRSSTFFTDLEAFRNPGGSTLRYLIDPPPGMTPKGFAEAVIGFGDEYEADPPVYRLFRGPNSNSGATFPLFQAGARVPWIPMAPALYFYSPD